MLKVADIRRTRFYQEAFEEGRKEGRKIGQKVAIERAIRYLLQAGMTIEKVASVFGLTPSKIRDLMKPRLTHRIQRIKDCSCLAKLSIRVGRFKSSST